MQDRRNPSDDPPQGDGPIKIDEVIAVCPDATGICIVGACDADLPLRYRAKFPSARIVAIEALAENFDRWLRPHAEFESICAVVGVDRSRRTLFVQDRNGIHGLYDRGFCVERRQVETMPLDDLLTTWRPEILVVDVEGAAIDVLRGGSSVFSAARAVLIETETEEFFKGQALAEESHDMLRSHRLVQRIDRAVEIEPGKFQHEELWSR